MTTAIAQQEMGDYAGVDFGQRFDDFIRYLRDPAMAPTVLSPMRYGNALQLNQQRLAALAHVHRNTLSRAPWAPSVQDYLRESLRVIKAAFDVNGDMRTALAWYSTEPLAIFDYKTAERLVSEGRSDDVIRYVASLEAGAAG